MGGVDNSVIDYINIKLNISAPHVIVPKTFVGSATPMVSHNYDVVLHVHVMHENIILCPVTYSDLILHVQLS